MTTSTSTTVLVSTMSNLEEHSGGGFTAVNGKDHGSAGLINGRKSSDDRVNGQPRITPPGQEKLTITTTSTQTKGWPSPKRSERPQYQALPHPDSEAHKRKRSGSVDHNSSSASSYHNHALPPPTKQTPTTASTESDGHRDEGRSQGQGDHQTPHSADSQYRHFLPSNEEGRQFSAASEGWQQRPYAPSPYGLPDEQLGEVLQRASQNMDHGPRHPEYVSPGDDEHSAHPYTPYDNERRELPTQSDPKKRKRNFSNRTKTGCMTCRRRKKKCDESRPECNNCLRGGFVCSGYPQRGQWLKAEPKHAPVPLVSKEGYEGSSYSQHSQYPSQPLNQARREPLPGYRGQNLRVDPQLGRPVNHDEDQPSASTIPSASVASPENNRLSAISYTGQTPTPVTASSSAYPGRQIDSPFYKRPGPLHDLSRQEQKQDSDTGTPQSANTLPQILHPQMQTESPHANPQVAAQLALSNLASTQRARTQKEEMLAGRHYFPFDKELVLERERCNGACWRFNSSTNPNNGVSPEERARLFRDILQPRDHVVSPTQASPVTPVGRVGENVVVEAPFNCDYGYNISIGQDVTIGKNCTILDTCEVNIGDRCSIGPNVNIYTATLPVDPKRRLGSRGPSLGRKITIGSDCWIGGGVTILPGRTIGKGSTVGAGSIVTRDVPPYTVVCGNPARVMRGVNPPSDG